MAQRLELEFTQCFRLSENHAAMFGRVWGKTIKGVNLGCEIRTTDESEAEDLIVAQYLGNVLCLGAKAGKMSKTLNNFERNYREKSNKDMVYATIQDRETNINPSKDTTVFTTFDSTKGMEKPVCIIFDWYKKYWHTRNSQPGANYNILRNIFCVAASRGKEEIVFVKSRPRF